MTLVNTKLILNLFIMNALILQGISTAMKQEMGAYSISLLQNPLLPNFPKELL